MLSPTATVIRDGKEKEISARELVPGDIIILKEGDVVPSDARLINVINLQVNEASLTGESMPVRKETNQIFKEASILDRKNIVFSGTAVTYGKGKAAVISTGMNTEFGKIAKQVATIEKEETPLEKRTKEIGKWFGLTALFICIAIIVVGLFRDIPFITILLFGVALAVAAVPEALPAVVTGSLAIGMYKMAKNHALVRKMSAVETLGSTSVICTDKTGTLTKGEMTVTKIFLNSDIINISGAGYEPKGDFLLNGNRAILQSEHYSLLNYGLILCNDAELIEENGKWRIRGDPTEGALIVVAAKSGFTQNEVKEKYPRINERPFSSERKCMTTIHSSENGDQIVFMKGAPEIVLSKCNYIFDSEKLEKLNDLQIKEILNINEGLASEALRVLALAYKKYSKNETIPDGELIENDLIFLGLVGMIDPPRTEVIRAIKICKEVKIKPIMITGDHKLTAVAIAKEIGIYQEGDLVLTGEELEKLNESEFNNIVERVTVYARVSPLHKLKIVVAWKKKEQIVAMTGDGVNDAPALKQSDIGIAMGITGTEVTKEAGDLVLTDDNFASIVNAVELGRWTYENIKKFLAYLLQANLVEIAVLSISFLMGFPLPLLAVHILYINLATDGLPAIALGVSPPDPDIMKRPPRSSKETIFTKDVKLFLLTAILLVVPIILWIFISSLPEGIQIARTRLFLILIFFELILALNCRSLKYNILEAKPHKLLLLVVFWEAILIIFLINIPAVRVAFDLAPIGIYDVILIIIPCLIVFISIESTKRLLNLWEKKNSKRNSI